MSIYVLRSDNLIKIGFSDNLRQRVNGIISSVPVPVVFVGHMPGDKSVEAHFHERFAEHRFSGEWFVETPEMRAAFDAILTPRLPELPKREKAQRRIASNTNLETVRERIRTETANRWPLLTHAERLDKFAEEIGWTRNRVKDFYYADFRVAVRSYETEELNRWLANRGPEPKDNADADPSEESLSPSL